MLLRIKNHSIEWPLELLKLKSFYPIHQVLGYKASSHELNPCSARMATFPTRASWNYSSPSTRITPNQFSILAWIKYDLILSLDFVRTNLTLTKTMILREMLLNRILRGSICPISWGQEVRTSSLDIMRRGSTSWWQNSGEVSLREASLVLLETRWVGNWLTGRVIEK